MSDNHTGLPHDLPEYRTNVPMEPQPMKARFVLMVGGPVDGQWRTVEARTVEVTELPPIQWTPGVTDTEIPMPVRHLYHVDRMAMFGFHVDVAVCERQFMGTAERNKAVLRALLQRDVAAQMGVL